MNNLQYFMIRRLHSLLGVIPLGVFLFVHLASNAMVVFGAKHFIHEVELIHSLGAALPFVEAAVIFIPLALHIVIGIFIAVTAKSNATNLGYGRNWAYTFQRWTGWLALVFIVWHTLTLRFLDVAGAGEGGIAMFNNYLVDAFKNPLFLLAYLVGGASVVFHFANGLCTFCMTWGITVGPKSQRVMAGFAFVVGAGLMGMLLAAIYGFATGAHVVPPVAMH